MNDDFDYRNHPENQNTENSQAENFVLLPKNESAASQEPIPVQAEISPKALNDAEIPQASSPSDTGSTIKEETGFVLQETPSATQEAPYYTAPQNQPFNGQTAPRGETTSYQYKPQYYAPPAKYEHQAQNGSQPGGQGSGKKKKKKPKNKMVRVLVATVAICTVASLALGGVSGALVTNYLLQNNKMTTSQNSSSSFNSSNSSSSNPVYTNSSGTNGEMSITDVINKVGDSVVAIDVSSSTGEFKDIPSSSSFSGSGVIISSDGYIVTNNHVVSGGTSIKVFLKNGDSYDAKVIGTDKTTDLALLKIEAGDLIYAEFGDSSTLQVGETAVAIGNPLGRLHGTATTGIISALDRELTIDNETMNLLQTDASISPGNSGGGLFNAKGELIGIVNAKSSAQYSEGIGFAIPINDVKPVVEALKENGYVTGRPVIGVSMIDISSQAMANMYRVDRLGTYIYDVEDNSPAQQAGLKSGDCIVSVNGKNVSTSAEVSQIVKESSVGDKLTFVVYRGNQQMTITVTVGEKTSTQTHS